MAAIDEASQLANQWRTVRDGLSKLIEEHGHGISADDENLRRELGLMDAEALRLISSHAPWLEKRWLASERDKAGAWTEVSPGHVSIAKLIGEMNARLSVLEALENQVQGSRHPSTSSASESTATGATGDLQQQFIAWFRAQCTAAEQLITVTLEREPRYYFEQSSSGPVTTFYECIDKWRSWTSAFVSGLRRRLRNADHLVRDAEQRFADSRLLRFRLEHWRTLGEVIREVDLSDRARYDGGGSGYIEFRNALNGARMEPEWRQVRHALLSDLRSFRDLVEDQASDLTFAALNVSGETPSRPPNPGARKPEGTMFHVRIEVTGEKKAEYVWDLLDEVTVRQRYVAPWQTGGTLVANGRRIAAASVRRLQVFSNGGGRADLENAWNQRADEAAANGIFTLQNTGEQWLNFATDQTDELLRTTGAAPRMVPERTEQQAAISAFVSYKWESQEHVAWVTRLATDLRARGIKTILDLWEVRLGQSFTEYMQQHINSADVILFVITPAAVAAAEATMGQGGALNFEVQMANSRRIQEGVRIIGIYRSGDRPPHYLRDHRYADFQDDTKYEASLSQLVDDLLGRAGPPPVGGVPQGPSTALRDTSRGAAAKAETYTKSGLEAVRDSLGGTASEIKGAISRAALLIRFTAGGAPKTSLSVGEQILSLFVEISATDEPQAIEKCRSKSINLFGAASPATGLTDQMRYLIESALKLADPPGPFK